MKKYTEKDKKRFPTNTVHQMRVPMFLPVSQVRNRDGKNEWVYESQFGRVTVRHHRLTQEHRNIVDVILSHYKPTAIHADGTWEFQFTLYDLQKNLRKKSTHNHIWVKSKLDELNEEKTEAPALLVAGVESEGGAGGVHRSAACREKRESC